MDRVPRHADAVVVGAGPGGAVVARRLAADGRQVVLVEAGPGGPRPPALAGLDLVAASEQAGRQWADLEVRDRPGGPRRAYRQGRGLGGGSMINGMLLTPGDRLDYRRWVGEWGCASWGPDDLGPWLDRVAAHYPSQQLEPGPISAALARAAADDGLPVGGTSLDADRLGVLAARLCAVDDRRWSAADADLDGDGLVAEGVRALVDGALLVVTGHGVERIAAGAGSRDHRVELATGVSIRTPLVVLGAGALGTPALLLRSAVTRRPVGATLSDHPSYAFTLRLRDDPGLRRRLAACPPVVSTVIRWSSGSGWSGDLQAIAIDRVTQPGHDEPTLAVVAVGLMAVTSRGSLVEPGGQTGHTGVDRRPGSLGLEVVTGLLDASEDRRRLRDGVRRVARLLRSAPFDDLVEQIHLDETGRSFEDLDAVDDAVLDRIVAGRPGPYAHPAGTCPLGPEEWPRSVTAIDPGRFGELIDRPGIRVVDASVFPDLVRGGLQLPVAAVAARIAEDIVAAS